MSPDRDQDYFCEGMAEEILNALTRIEGLRVAARTSSFQFKGRAADVRKVAQELGVNTVLEGSVRKAGTQLRVTAQLINAGDGYHLWSDRYDRGIEDVFAIQDEIATKITEALKLRLTRQDRRCDPGQADGRDPGLRLLPAGTPVRQPVRQAAHRIRHSDVQQGDRDRSELRAGLCRSHARERADVHVLRPGPEVLRGGRSAPAPKRSRWIPGSAEAHTTRGIAELMGGHFDAAEQAFERAIALNPKSFDAHYYCARGCVTRGEYARAAAMFEKAAEVRPEDYQALLLAVQAYRTLGRRDEERSAAERGFERARRTLELNPGDVRALYLGASALHIAGPKQRGQGMGRACARAGARRALRPL